MDWFCPTGDATLPSPIGRRAGDEGERCFRKRGICRDAVVIASLQLFGVLQMLRLLTLGPSPSGRGKGAVSRGG